VEWEKDVGKGEKEKKVGKGHRKRSWEHRMKIRKK
jgi:hypothetical protein